MHKFKIIFKREYLLRVTDKKFLLFTFGTPLLFALIGLIPALSTLMTEKEHYTVHVIDPSGMVLPMLAETNDAQVQFVKSTMNVDSLKNFLVDKKTDGGLILPDSTALTTKTVTATYMSSKSPGMRFKDKLEDKLEDKLSQLRLIKAGLPAGKLDAADMDFEMNTQKITEEGTEDTSADLGYILGMAMAYLNYIMVFMYGGMVMKGVMEEKTNRIMEVIISSVKPIELMAGKVLAIALVGLTQVFLWILLMGGLMLLLSLILGISGVSPDPDAMASGADAAAASDMKYRIMDAVKHFKFSLIFYFIFFFMGGYLLYGSLFAAVGASVDQEQDAQQVTIIVSIPFILAMLILPAIMANPNGGLAFWTSMIPLFSPIIMMVRLASTDVPIWEVILSILCMVGGVIGAAWLAARIYRVGVLMYGKKITVKELAKWMWVK